MNELIKNKQKFRAFVGIMAACFFGQATNCFSLMLSGISEEFPTTSLILVQTVYSAAFYMNPVANIAGGVLAKYFRKKQILVVSHVVALLSALLVFVLPHSIPMLILVAALIGAGAGFAGVSYNGLMAEHFSAEERALVFGFSSVSISIGGAFMSTLCGTLAATRWDLCFLYFLVLIPIIIVEVMLLPKGEKEEQKADEGQHKSSLLAQIRELFNSKSSIMFVTAFVYGIVCCCFGYNISYMCDTMTSGIAYSVYMIASAVAGLLSGIVAKTLKQYTIPAVLFVYAAALAIPLLSSGKTAIFICAVFIGLAGGIFAPLLMAELSVVVKPNQATLALGLFTGLAMLGSIVYPYIITAAALKINEAAATRFALCAVITIVLAGVNLLKKIKDRA